MARSRPAALVLALLLVSLPGLAAEQAPTGGKTVAQWIADLASPDAQVRSGAAVALGKLGDAGVEAIGPLTAQLTDKDDTARGNAAWALGAIGWDDDAAVKGLAAALADPVPGVRGRAVVALRRIGVDSPDVLATIKAMAEKDADPGVRRSARDALAELLPSDKEAAADEPPESDTRTAGSPLEDLEVFAALPDTFTEYLGPLRKHNNNLTAVGLKVVSIDEDPRPATKDEAAKWAESTRAVGREMVAESKAFAGTLHGFANAKTRKGLAEEIELVRSNTELVYEVISQYRGVANVDERALKNTIIKETIAKEAKAYLLKRLKQRIAERFDSAGLREVLTAASWEQAFNKTVTVARKHAEAELDKAARKAFGLPFHDEASLRTALQQRFHELAERTVAKIIVRLAPHGIIIKVGAAEAVEWLEKNFWPHLREALRQKGNLEPRVARSIETLDTARQALYRLPTTATMPQVQQALNAAKGTLAATRYLERDLTAAKRTDLMRKHFEAQERLRQVMDITEQRFMLGYREAVEELGKSEEELRTLIWLAELMVGSVKAPPVKEAPAKQPEEPPAKPPAEPAPAKPQPRQPGAKFEGLSFTAELQYRFLDERTDRFEGTISVTMTASGTISGSYSGTRTRDFSAIKISTPGTWQYSGSFQGKFDAAALATTTLSATIPHKMTESWDYQYWYPNRDNGILKTETGSRERDATIEIGLPAGYKAPSGGTIKTATVELFFQRK